MNGHPFLRVLVPVGVLLFGCCAGEVRAAEGTASAVESGAGTLRYGADLEGGLPYMFEDWRKPGRLIGFEVEIIEAIAKEIGRRPVMVQNDWDKLIPGLSRDLYDMAAQGQEITPEHEEAVLFSLPYFVTGLQLCVRRNEFLISNVGDCKGRVAGTLKESQAFYLLNSLGGVDIRAYPTEVNGFDDLANGRLDAVLFDAPVALYYGGPRPEVKFVRPEISRIAYGFAFSKDKKELLERVNAALMRMRKDGELRSILDRWNLWNQATANEFQDFTTASAEPVMYNEWMKHIQPRTGLEQRIKRYAGFLPILGKGAVLTLEVSMLAMLLAVVFGFFLATVRVYAPRPFGILATVYIEIIRGTPVLIQLFFIFYGLPALGIRFSPFWAGVLGLGLNYAAYEAENYRAGFTAVPHSQMEAALGLAMTRWQAIRHVIAPQAFRVVTNDFISLLKDSSLVSVITMVELTKTYSMLATTYYDYFGTGILVAALYLLIGLPFVRLARWTERRLAVAHPQQRR
jgi:polar amino acid transport system substrate-binding protein